MKPESFQVVPYSTYSWLDEAAAPTPQPRSAYKFASHYVIPRVAPSPSPKRLLACSRVPLTSLATSGFPLFFLSKMLKMPGASLAFVLVSAMLIWEAHVAALTIPSGRDKDAWPELHHEDWEVAKATLESSGFVANVYVQHPGGSKPANIGNAGDVWLYTDGSTTYEIPRRGVWHPNRLIPGWPELTGTFYTSAIAKIKSDYLGVTVVFSPKGSPVYTTEIRMDRVILSINSTDGTVIGIPSIY